MIEPRYLTALGVVAGYAAFCGTIAWRWRRRARPGGAADAGADCLVAYASQTGFAEQIAQRTAEALRAQGRPVRLAGLEAVDSPLLTGVRHIFFVVSTAGEGDAPDQSARFIARVMRAAPDLSRTRYGLLALGDSSYARFCAFGRQLDSWLREHGATPLFERIEVDDGDPEALGRWQREIGVSGWDAPAAEPWTLVERRLLNPGSQGEAAYHLAFAPVGDLPAWQPGDIASVLPRNAPAEVARLLAQLALPADDGTLGAALAVRQLPRELEALAGLSPQAVVTALPPLTPRDYSIASLPGDGRLELLVRLARHADGRPGLASGWLALHLSLGARVMLTIRRNRGFHPPADDRPMLLIGNGTGLAGLRAHLKAREAAGRRRNWLIFGERSRAQDYFHRSEIEAWQASGTLARLDLAFSRDQAERVYVQDLLRARAEAVRSWVAQGAAIYVCGSRVGMAEGVQDALREVLGEAALETLRDAGRYRRDVY
ncbi:flavodoxin domain-containing protein [Roseomonas sp. F4]